MSTTSTSSGAGRGGAVQFDINNVAKHIVGIIQHVPRYVLNIENSIYATNTEGII